MKETSIELLFKKLLIRIKQVNYESFSGIGLLLYNHKNNLEKYHSNLVNTIISPPKFHISSEHMVNYLVDISSYKHAYHDGFHFINEDGYITHIAQFLSPPIDKNITNIEGQGARTLCSRFGSIIPGVIMIGNISLKQDVYLFKNGEIYVNGL